MLSCQRMNHNLIKWKCWEQQNPLSFNISFTQMKRTVPFKYCLLYFNSFGCWFSFSLSFIFIMKPNIYPIKTYCFIQNCLHRFDATENKKKKPIEFGQDPTMAKWLLFNCIHVFFPHFHGDYFLFCCIFRPQYSITE